MVTRMSLTSQSIASGSVDETVDQIHAQTSAELVLSSAGGTLTADGAEQTLYYDNEPLGCWVPRSLFIDCDNMLGGDTIAIKVYHRTLDGGGLQLLDYQSYTGADGGLANGRKVLVVDLNPNRHGYRLTLQQTAGTNRDYPWEFFMEV